MNNFPIVEVSKSNFNYINNEEKIPKIVYRTSGHNFLCLPHPVWDLYKKEKELNRSYEYVYFDDMACESFIEDNYGTHIRDLYLKLVPTAFRADFFRYLLLYKNGGVYMDFTQHTLRPLDFIIKDYKEVFVKDYYNGGDVPENGLYNAFIATVKGTKILENAIDNCIEHIETSFYGEHCLDVTGPAMLGKVFIDLYGEIKTGKINNNLQVLSFIKEPDEHGENIGYISNEENQMLIRNRLKEHYILTYRDKNVPRYPELWEKRMIYKGEKFDARLVMINGIFRKLLLRRADSEGLNYYYKSGFNQEQIEKSIKESEEYSKLNKN